MACLLAPAATAIVTTSLKKKIPSKYHIEWLNTMLWGGSIMLLIEHIAHGEIVFFPPFLTAMQNPSEIPVMLKEIVVTGGTMTVVIISVWMVMVLIANKVIANKKVINKITEA